MHKISDTPRFTHDCDKCVFMGHINAEQVITAPSSLGVEVWSKCADVYICPVAETESGTIVVRYGNGKSDKISKERHDLELVYMAGLLAATVICEWSIDFVKKRYKGEQEVRKVAQQIMEMAKE